MHNSRKLEAGRLFLGQGRSVVDMSDGGHEGLATLQIIIHLMNTDIRLARQFLDHLNNHDSYAQSVTPGGGSNEKSTRPLYKGEADHSSDVMTPGELSNLEE